MPSWLKSLLTVALLGLATLAMGETAVPPNGSRVTDLTETLSVDQTAMLSRELERIDQETGARVQVLIVRALDGEPIEAYAQRVFDTWKPGRAGIDDGVLLVLAKSERKIRIAVGRGLEGAIPDLAAKRITSTYMVPAFKQDQFAQGFLDASRELERLIRAEKLPAPTPTSTESTSAMAGLLCFALFLAAGLGVSLWYGRANNKARRDLLDAQLRQEQATERAFVLERLRARSVRRSPEPGAGSRAAVARSATARSGSARAPSGSTLWGSPAGSTTGSEQSNSNLFDASSSQGTSAGGGVTDSY